MPAIPLGTGEYHRTVGRLPHLRLKNMYIEKDPSNLVDGIVRLQRPGLAPWQALDAEKIEYVWRQDGTFSGDYLVSAGGILYRVTKAGTSTAIGSIGLGIPKIAARQADAVIISNGVRYLTDGVTISAISSPVGAAAQSVSAINSYYIIPRRDGQIFDWIVPGATTIDPLNFASAERTPDNIEDVAISGDEIWFLGGAGEEVWIPNNDINAPFVRISGRVYNYGCINRNTVTVSDGAIYWVTIDNEVVRAKGTPEVISDNSISERLRLSSGDTMRAWFFMLDQHGFYNLTCDQGTVAFDITGPTWSEFSSWTRPDWRAHLGAQDGKQIVCGDNDSGKLWLLDPAASNDDGDPLDRQLTGQVAHSGPRLPCSNISLKVAAGWSPSPTFEPRMEVRWSDDQGNLWVDWRQISLGAQGQYDQETALRKCGLFKAPGRIIEWRMTDDAICRVSYARYNEAVG